MFLDHAKEDGYRSLTYSLKIDPEKMMCENEFIVPGGCTKKGCAYLHFSDLEMTGMYTEPHEWTSNHRSRNSQGIESIICRRYRGGGKEVSGVVRCGDETFGYSTA